MTGKKIRIVGGEMTVTAKGDYSMYATESNIDMLAGKKVVAKGLNDGVVYKKFIDPPHKVLAGECVVEFRPHNNWTGEFGFDWVRMGDTGLSGDVWYRNIIGKNRNAAGNIDQSTNYAQNIVPDIKEYEKLMRKFLVLKISFKKDFYIVPWMSLYKGKTAKLSLKINIKEPPKKLIFKYDETLFTLNQKEINKKDKGKFTLPDYLTITCTKTFNEDKFIEVLADDELVGKLKIHKNGKVDRKKLDVVLVKVKTSAFGTRVGETGQVTNEKSKLEKHLHQALITPNVLETTVDLRMDTTFNSTFLNASGVISYGHDTNGNGLLHSYMLNNYNLKSSYPNHFIIYVFDLAHVNAGGEAFGINSDNALVFSMATRKPTCLVHELLHSLGLYHTFDNDGTFTFIKNQTENIMDYSTTRRTIYKWQWDKIRTHSLVKHE